LQKIKKLDKIKNVSKKVNNIKYAGTKNIFALGKSKIFTYESGGHLNIDGAPMRDVYMGNCTGIARLNKH